MNHNSAEQQNTTLHLIGYHLMWGIDNQFFNNADRIAPAINANIENGPVPMMAPRREKSKPAVADAPAANSNIVNLFARKS